MCVGTLLHKSFTQRVLDFRGSVGSLRFVSDLVTWRTSSKVFYRLGWPRSTPIYRFPSSLPEGLHILFRSLPPFRYRPPTPPPIFSISYKELVNDTRFVIGGLLGCFTYRNRGYLLPFTSTTFVGLQSSVIQLPRLVVGSGLRFRLRGWCFPKHFRNLCDEFGEGRKWGE